MAERFDESILGMVRRDRNHPSVTIWGLLNETPDGPVFRHAVGVLPRAAAAGRLAAGDAQQRPLGRRTAAGSPGSKSGGIEERTDPCVTFNATEASDPGTGHHLVAGPTRLSSRPRRGVRRRALDRAGGRHGRVRGRVRQHRRAGHDRRPRAAQRQAAVRRRDQRPRRRPDGRSSASRSRSARATRSIASAASATATTAPTRRPWRSRSRPPAARRTTRRPISPSEQNPNGAWSYGQLRAGPKPDAATLRPVPHGAASRPAKAALSNPGSTVWEDVLADQHPYQRVPHTADIIRTLRTIDGSGLPLFISEYGIGSAVDLWRATRHYERLGDDARRGRAVLPRTSWTGSWPTGSAGGWPRRSDGPEDFFAQSNCADGRPAAAGAERHSGQPERRSATA